MPDEKARLRAFQAQNNELDAQRVAQLNKPPHGLLNIRVFPQDESATGLDLPHYGGACWTLT